MTATGVVQYIPSSALVSSTFSGFPASNALDGDLTTVWAANTSTGEYFGVDLGAAAAPTAYRYVPRTGPGEINYDYQSTRQVGVTFQSSAASNFASPTTYDTITQVERGRYNERTVTTTPARYWRMYRGNAAYDLAELRLIGPQTSGVSDRPVSPTMTPWGGRFPTGKATVTLASATTSASIYYTTDGTTPTTSSTLYAGPFQLAVGASGTTLKAIAYDAGCSTTTSEVVATGYFKPWAYKPAEDWYDDRGVLVEAHDGGINYSNGRFYWFGVTANKDQIGRDVVNNQGVFLYSSTDLLNWRYDGRVLDVPTGVYCHRPHIVYNASTSKWVLWTRGSDYGTNFGWADAATASTLAGPWTWQVTGLRPDSMDMNDCTVYQDGTSAWLVYTEGTNTDTYASPLAADYLSTTGSPVKINPASPPRREAPALFKRGSQVFWISSSTNYYDSTSTFELRWGTRTDLSGTFATLSALFASEPTATIYNGQSTCVLPIPGRDGYMYMSDRWNKNVLYSSRYVWLPLTFPTSTSVQASVPAAWTMSTFPLSSAPVITGGSTTATVGLASGSFTYALQNGAFFAGDETVTLTATGGVVTVTATDGVIVGNGTSAVTVTPSTVTSFTFTFTPSTDGAQTVTPTNSQGWTNPATQTVTAEFIDYTAPFTVTVTAT